MAPPAPGATPPVAKAAAPPASAPAAPASVPPAAKPAGPAQAAPPHPKPLGVPVVFAPTRPGEPPFQLKLDPHDRFVFKGDRMFEGSTTIDVKLTNTTNARQTFKVKCTSNEIFRVRPPLGFCNVNETVTIKVTFASKVVPLSARHFFAIYHMKSDEQNKTARQVWTPQSKAEGVHRVLVFFEKNDGSSAATTALVTPPPVGAPAAGGQPAPAKAPMNATGAPTMSPFAAPPAQAAKIPPAAPAAAVATPVAAAPTPIPAK
uniref:Major sperm protein n=1 Tax=Ascaris lumbricoides TaxID=6252 RepID=A0A0M3HMM6_ASCLU